MDIQTIKKRVYSTSGVNIVAGLWLVLAPFALGYAAELAALWNSIIVGLVIAVLAIIRVSRPLQNEGVSWTNCVLGVWLIIAPFVLGYSVIMAAMWNDIIVGLIVVALATTSAISSREVHRPPHAAH